MPTHYWGIYTNRGASKESCASVINIDLLQPQTESVCTRRDGEGEEAKKGENNAHKICQKKTKKTSEIRSKC